MNSAEGVRGKPRQEEDAESMSSDVNALGVQHARCVHEEADESADLIVGVSATGSRRACDGLASKS